MNYGKAHTATGLLDRFCIGENITVMRDILGAASKKMKG